jgi:hypothetical protein
VKDTSGLLIFDLRHHGSNIKNLWTIKGPDGVHMAELKHVSSKRRSDLDIVIANGKGEEDEVLLQMRQNEESANRTRVLFRNSAFLSCSSRNLMIFPISVK